MLKLKQINKEYKTGELVQHALNNVSLNLRDNEFVAILGPSGSGKTTVSPPKNTPTATGTPTRTTPSALCSRAIT